MTPTLRTERLLLRPFAETDRDALFALQSDRDALRYWDAPPWQDRAQADRFIESCTRMADEGRGVRCAVERDTDGAFIGWCVVATLNTVHRSATMGYSFAASSWGRGYATEAAKALLQWAFATFDLIRVQAETDTRNAASARVLEKLGFAREGTLRQNCIVDGEVSDSWVYGLLRADFDVTSGSPTTSS